MAELRRPGPKYSDDVNDRRSIEPLLWGLIVRIILLLVANHLLGNVLFGA